ncbi:MAG: glycosyltransferase [Candidatus Sericytochromatia bacterium]|nr:glycosyltransferase [Candidatus Tanganyikabacteria bacterium]
MRSVRTLHSVFAWLPLTQPWLARLVADAPEPRILALVRDGAPRDPRLVALTDGIPVVGLLGAAYQHLAGRAWPLRGDRRFGAVYARLVAAAARDLGPHDVVHAHFGDQGYRSRLVRAPLVVSFYGHDYTLARDPWWAAAYREVFAAARLVVAEAPHAASRLCDLGCPPAKVRIHPLGVDFARINFRPRFPRMPIEVLFVGRFEDKKGLPDALEAVARAGPGFRLTVIGDGPAAPALKAHAARLGLDVAWRGLLPHQAVREALDRADLLIAPSRTAASGDTEGGLPIVVVEALAAGLPVLATRHADLPWAVEDGRTGRLVPERDPAALAAALQGMAAHPERWPIMGALGRAAVLARHDARRQPGRLRALYEEATAGKPCATPTTTSGRSGNSGTLGNTNV